ncbi:50S ribosomal protein L17 [Candidatus Methylacidithermus pantelleriae]|uniref:Large ribosomal subunit protein bL17 n=1 Tax=Candidatus Methylacidithermus pantelleriae TaxID=2744239 RepID=A0A8J2BM58_9BACT|nr:50S ribosomal protein L17 [Candidatus Methylacidithermus pantelleriae]CAF0695421.1 50S ribosomal subunit protein L17 [Candidatus Methylacidithermus pantelleriae]
MRHRKKTVKLGRKAESRKALLASLAVELVQHGRIITTLAKAKALRPFAEKLVTLAKKGTLHHRRLAVARIRDKQAVRKLFGEIAPRLSDRPGGYTRITKLWARRSDAARLALIEWVGTAPSSSEAGGTKESPAGVGG